MSTIYEHEDMESSLTVEDDGALDIQVSDCAYTGLTMHIDAPDARKIYNAMKSALDKDDTTTQDEKNWEVIMAISGNCVFVKGGLTKDEANDFIRNANQPDGTMHYVWPDGEQFFAQENVAAAWSRRARQ